MIPTATPLRLGPQELMATACMVCYGRTELREPERESKLIRHVLTQDPPHLSIGEHARFTVEVPRPRTEHLELLLTLPRPPIYRVRLDPGVSLLGLNVSHVRQLRARVLGGYGDRLIPLIRPLVPDALADFLTIRLSDGMELVADVNLTPYERRIFPSRSFLIRCSRAASHQLVRHRGISWEQRSQRYCDEGELDFIWPPIDTGHVDLSVREADIRHEYQHLRAMGWHKEDARAILPNAAATTLIATAPMEAWRHLIKLRGERKAQAEIRYLALHIHRALLADLPDAVEDLTVDLTGLDPWLEQE